MNKVSNCCQFPAKEGYEDSGICGDCLEHCEYVCEMCEGTGEVSVDEDDGEGHTMRGVGTQKCLCQIKDRQDDMDDDS